MVDDVEEWKRCELLEMHDEVDGKRATRRAE